MVASLAKTKALDKLGKGKASSNEEKEKGIPLAPSQKDLRPWYSEKAREPDIAGDEKDRYVPPYILLLHRIRLQLYMCLY